MDFNNDIRQQYTGEKGEKYHAKVNHVSERAYPWVARLRHEKIFSFINEQDVVLEYGVGTGWNISQITCKRRIGYDLSEHLEKLLIKQGIEFLNRIDAVQDESIDVVLCHHVLEHTSNPIDILTEINRILCKGGKLLLFVPNETGKKFNYYDAQNQDHHLFSWNVQTLATLVEKAGFKVIEGSTERFGYDRFSGVWADKLHLGEFGFRIFRKLIHLIKPNYEIRIISIKK